MSSVYSEIIVVCLLVLGGYFVLTARAVKSTKRSDSRTWNLVHNGLMLLGYVLAYPTIRLGPLSVRFLPESPVFEIIGVVLVVAGVAFAIWARRILGADWSGTVTIKTGHRLVRSGPYAIVRNPIYTGDIVIVLGMAVALGAMSGFLGLALMVAAVWHKGRTEERFLLAEFGDEYADYQREVGFLLPRLLPRVSSRGSVREAGQDERSR